MDVERYSLKNDGEKNLSTNFKVKEFKCNDGSDAILIDGKLVEELQKIRDHFGVPITINSAYRTPTYNKKVGGANNSQHIFGTAADIVVKGITPLIVAQYAEALKMNGVGYYPAGQGNFTHVDTRPTKSRWKKENGKEITVSGFGGTSFVQQVQFATGFETKTMAYLEKYKYADPLFYKLAEAIYKKAAKGSTKNNVMQVQEATNFDNSTMAYLMEYEYADPLFEKLAKAMR